MYQLLTVILSMLLINLALAQTKGIEIADDLGNTIYLDQTAQRIVSLAPHVTEMLFAIGAGKLLVAGVSHSDYPEAAKSIPQVGTYTQINLEILVALQPDLVIAWHSGNGPVQIDQLRKLGFNLYVTNPERPEDIAKNLLKLGHLTGHQHQADQASQQFIEELQWLRSQYSHRPKISVFYQVWDRPLVTLNGDHLISRLIELCGGSNVFSDLGTLAPLISLEAVLSANPEVIIASGMGDQRPDWLNMWLNWPKLRAVKDQHLFFIPPDIVQRHSPRILQGARILCQQLEVVRSKKAVP